MEDILFPVLSRFLYWLVVESWLFLYDDASPVSMNALLTATELVDEPLPAHWSTQPDASGKEKETMATSRTEQSADGHLQGLLPDVDRLACRMTQTELQRCSAEQLVHIHNKLGDMMKHVVVELHTRLCQTQGEP